MRGIRSFMGWSHIPDLTSAAASDDNPFAHPKKQLPGKVSVQMPTDDWLCRKLSRLNVTLAEGYPSCGSEAGGLLKDQNRKACGTGCFFTRKLTSTVSSWGTDASCLNSSYSRIARQAGLASTPPTCRHISQETLRKWEKSAREASVICNQAASFNRCLFKVQQGMQDQLKAIRTESKAKGSTKVGAASDELQYLMDFNASITQAVAKTMKHLTDFVFVSIGNLTLARHDSYLTHLKSGVKPDTLSALRTAPLQLATLFTVL